MLGVLRAAEEAAHRPRPPPTELSVWAVSCIQPRCMSKAGKLLAGYVLFLVFSCAAQANLTPPLTLRQHGSVECEDERDMAFLLALGEVSWRCSLLPVSLPSQGSGLWSAPHGFSCLASALG